MFSWLGFKKPKETFKQSIILKNLGTFLKEEKRDDEDVQDFLQSQGKCQGITLLWGYSKSIEEQPIRMDEKTGQPIPRDDYSTFFKPTIHLAQSIPFKKKTGDEKKILDRFIALIEFFQNPTLYINNIRPGRFEDVVVDTKEQALHKEYTVIYEFDKSKLTTALEQIVKPNRLTTIAINPIDTHIMGHIIGIYLNNNGELFFFDANHEEGEIQVENINELIALIFNALGDRNKLVLIIENYHLKSKKQIDQSKEEDLEQEKEKEKESEEKDSIYPNVKKMLEKFGKIKNRDILTDIFLLAVETDCVESAEFCLNCDLDPDTTDEAHQSLLYHAVIKDSPEILKVLLDRGAKVNRPSLEGIFPLLIAANEGYFSVADLLLKNGAKINIKQTPQQITPLHVAAGNGHKEIVELLLDYAKYKREKFNVKKFINEGSRDGITALLAAVKGQHFSIVKLLLAYGANVDKANDDGITPLMMAAMLGLNRTTALLIENQAQTELFNHQGKTAWMLAIENNHFDLLHLFPKLDAGTIFKAGLQSFSQTKASGFKSIFSKKLPVETKKYFYAVREIAPDRFQDLVNLYSKDKGLDPLLNEYLLSLINKPSKSFSVSNK